MRAETISQFRILRFIKQNFDIDVVDITLSDDNTIEMWDLTGNVAIITTSTEEPDDSDYMEVEDGIFFCEI